MLVDVDVNATYRPSLEIDGCEDTLFPAFVRVMSELTIVVVPVTMSRT